jgi:hypothetical protein
MSDNFFDDIAEIDRIVKEVESAQPKRHRVTVTFAHGGQLTLDNGNRGMMRGQLRVLRKAMKSRREFVVSDANGEIARGIVALVEVLP